MPDILLTPDDGRRPGWSSPSVFQLPALPAPHKSDWPPGPAAELRCPARQAPLTLTLGTHSTEPGTWACTSPGEDGLRGRKRQRGARHRGGLLPAGRGWPGPSPTLNPKGQPGQEKGCTALLQSRVPGTPGTDTLLAQLPESRGASLWGVPLAQTPRNTAAGSPTTTEDFLVASVPTCPRPSPALEGPRALAGKSACKGLRDGSH